jgi:hypothetical protein
MGTALMRAERKEVLPAPGGPETMTDALDLIAPSRNPAAAEVSEPSETNESSV